MELSIPNFFKKKPVKVFNQDVISPRDDDGYAVINSGGLYITEYQDGNSKNRKDNIEKWRAVAKSPDVSSAISEIITDAIVIEENQEIVVLGFLDESETSEKIKDKLSEEFKYVLRLMNFHKKSDELFEDWVVDGVQYFHKIFDDSSVKKGIQKLVRIESTLCEPVREVTKSPNSAGIEVVTDIDEYFLVENTTTINATTRIKIPKEAIAYAHSGIIEDGHVMSIVEAAVKPNNQLTNLEDSTVIYSVARAPQKRVFYVDVGNLPKTKAEAYMNGLITKFKNKIVYNPDTGTIKDSRHIQAMVEDYWLPRKAGSKGTEISTIDGGGSMDNLDEMMYFRKKIYKAFNVPTTRLDPEQSFSMGRDGDITRDEVKFNRYINKLRMRYSVLFIDLLKTQATTKGILTNEEWDEAEPDIKFVFQDSTHFAELIEAEMLSQRFEAVQSAEEITGQYVSHEWIRKTLLKQTDEQIKLEDQRMKKESGSEEFALDYEVDTAEKEALISGAEEIAEPPDEEAPPAEEPEPDNKEKEKE